jgi:hypothetical protein
MPTARKAVVTDETIRVHAYHLWEREGRPHGRDQEYWHRAATELGSLRTVAATRKPAAKSAAATKAKPAKPAKVKSVAAAKPAVATKG